MVDPALEREVETATGGDEIAERIRQAQGAFYALARLVDCPSDREVDRIDAAQLLVLSDVHREPGSLGAEADIREGGALLAIGFEVYLERAGRSRDVARLGQKATQP